MFLGFKDEVKNLKRLICFNQQVKVLKYLSKFKPRMNLKNISVLIQSYRFSDMGIYWMNSLLF
jgi:hypothetical protein